MGARNESRRAVGRVRLPFCPNLARTVGFSGRRSAPARGRGGRAGRPAAPIAPGVPLLSSTSSACASRVARGSCAAMIARTSASARPLRARTRATWTSSGQSTTSTRSTSGRSRRGLEQQRHDEQAVGRGPRRHPRPRLRRAISGCRMASRRCLNEASPNACLRNQARSRLPSAATASGPRAAATARWPAAPGRRELVGDDVGVDDRRAEGREGAATPPTCRCRCRRSGRRRGSCLQCPGRYSCTRGAPTNSAIAPAIAR